MSIDLGDVVPLSFQIRDASGTLANGGAVTLNITLPDGTADGPHPLTPTTTGVYDYNFVPTQVGRHVARCVSTGTNSASYTDAFDVAPADLGGIISLADARAHLRFPSTYTVDDEELRLMLTSATSLVEDMIGVVIPRPVVEVMGALNSIVLNQSPVISVTSMLTQQNVDLLPYFTLNGPAGMLQLVPTTIGYPFAYRPYNFPGQPLDRLYYAGLLPFYQGQPITITYKAGRQTIPAAVQLATRVILEDLWATRRLVGSTTQNRDQDVPPPGVNYAMAPKAVELLASVGNRAPVVG